MINEKHGKFVLPLKFDFDDRNRTSHYIIFVTKHIQGYNIMKDVMASQGYVDEDEVPSLAYYRPDKEPSSSFAFARPYAQLGDVLCSKFAGRTMTRNEVFTEHNVGEPFLEKHYRRKLLELENQNRIYVDPDSSTRRKGTFAKHVRVTFPSRSENGK